MLLTMEMVEVVPRLMPVAPVVAGVTHLGNFFRNGRVKVKKMDQNN